jgi:hypothetical protein
MPNVFNVRKAVKQLIGTRMIGDVLQEDEPENDVFILGGVKIVAEFVGGGPQRCLETEVCAVAIAFGGGLLAWHLGTFIVIDGADVGVGGVLAAPFYGRNGTREMPYGSVFRFRAAWRPAFANPVICSFTFFSRLNSSIHCSSVSALTVVTRTVRSSQSVASPPRK